MKEFWNRRYKEGEDVYGENPNVYFEEIINKLDLTGKALFPADGEGRNSVYAATKGLEVVAFDISDEGKKKALKLAMQKQVEVDYKVGELSELNFKSNSFDVVVLIYAHFNNDLRNQLHNEFVGLLKPNGYLILEGFSENHIAYQARQPNIGGPKSVEILFSKQKIEKDFKKLKTIELEEIEIELNEGEYHKGTGSVIRYVGRK